MYETSFLTNTKNKRYLFIDILKIVAIMLVVVTHTVGFNMPIRSIDIPLFLAITGFNMANSMFNKKQTLKTYYTQKNLFSKIVRFLIPYLVLVFTELIILICRDNLTIVNALILVFGGGFGEGAYYTPLILQIILLFPLIFTLIKKDKTYILLFFSITFIFEIIINLLCPDTTVVRTIYRYSICRQLFYIASGCYMFFYKGKLEDIFCIIFACIGLYFFSIHELGIHTPIIFKSWVRQSLPFGVLAIGILYFCVRALNINYYSYHLATWSNATYHIFLIQQLYFWLFANESFASSPVFNIVICCTIGIIFYLIQSYITNFIKSKKKKKLKTT